MRQDTAKFEKYADRGVCRYVRDGPNLYVQWNDRRCVPVLSTVHRGDDHVHVLRKGKNDPGEYVEKQVPQTVYIELYNKKNGRC